MSPSQSHSDPTDNQSMIAVDTMTIKKVRKATRMTTATQNIVTFTGKKLMYCAVYWLFLLYGRKSQGKTRDIGDQIMKWLDVLTVGVRRVGSQKRIQSRRVSLKLLTPLWVYNIIPLYAPQLGRHPVEKE